MKQKAKQPIAIKHSHRNTNWQKVGSICPWKGHSVQVDFLPYSSSKHLLPINIINSNSKWQVLCWVCTKSYHFPIIRLYLRVFWNAEGFFSPSSLRENKLAEKSKAKDWRSTNKCYYDKDRGPTAMKMKPFSITESFLSWCVREHL